jgi:acylphosphatase
MRSRRRPLRIDPAVGEVTRCFLIEGKVQGVFFRQSARIEAQRLNLSGTVRNLSNGSVEVIARGEAAALDALREWLGRGPKSARVDAVLEQPVVEEPQIPVPGEFLVR